MTNNLYPHNQLISTIGFDARSSYLNKRVIRQKWFVKII